MTSKPGYRVGAFSAVVTALQFFFLATLSPSGLAQPPSISAATARAAAAASAETLTQQLIQLHTRAGSVKANERAAVNAHALQIAKARRTAFAALIEEAPADVLRLAIPAGFGQGFDATAQETLEQSAILDGELEVLHSDHRDARLDRYEYLLTLADARRYSVHFAEAAPEAHSGARVRLHGVLLKGIGAKGHGRLAGALAVRHGRHDLTLLEAGSTGTSPTATAALTTALPNTFGAQRTLVILVNFADKATQPYTPDQARNVVFTTTSNYDLENSFQQTWLTGDVTPWQTIALSSTVCDSSTLATQAKQAATTAGYVLSDYTRYVYAFPSNACSWWGLGSVGGKPSSSWINGSIALKVVGHEMGHNFGLYHAHTLECGTAVVGSNCTSNDYGDTLDMMGGPASGHFNAFEKERLGWLDYGSSPAIATVQSDGAYTLDPYAAAPGSNAKALKILKSTDATTGRKTWYYVEYRRAIGFDGFLANNANVLNGVVIHTGTEAVANSSYLLDLSPTSPASFGAPALPIGQSYTDAESGVTINPSWADAQSAIVNVSFGPMACVRGRPTLALSPAQNQWVRPGASLTYTITVTNTDNAGCAATGFALQSAVPTGWSVSFAPQSVTVTPGATSTASMTLVIPASGVDGLYTVPVTVTHGANALFSSSNSVSVVAAAALSVNLGTDKRIYARGQTILASAQASGGSLPAANATMRFVLTKANGVRSSVTTTANSAGVANASFRLSKRDPVGTYQLQVDTSTSGGLTGTASTSISVQ